MKRKSQIGKPIPVSSQAPAKKKCTACSGSGYYDVKGSPKCGACEGTGVDND